MNFIDSKSLGVFYVGKWYVGNGFVEEFTKFVPFVTFKNVHYQKIFRTVFEVFHYIFNMPVINVIHPVTVLKIYQTVSCNMLKLYPVDKMGEVI